MREIGGVSGCVRDTITRFGALLARRVTHRSRVRGGDRIASCRSLPGVVVNVYSNSNVKPVVSTRDRHILGFVLGSRVSANGMRLHAVSKLAVRGHVTGGGTVPSSILTRVGTYGIVLGTPAAALGNNALRDTGITVEERLSLCTGIHPIYMPRLNVS